MSVITAKIYCVNVILGDNNETSQSNIDGDLVDEELRMINRYNNNIENDNDNNNESPIRIQVL